jgi:hypothetical protein
MYTQKYLTIFGILYICSGMNGHSDTISKYFKTVISSKVGEQCNSESFLEDIDRKKRSKRPMIASRNC